MKTAFVSAIAVALVVAGLSTLGWRAVAGGDLVKFRESYAEGVHYATVKRGNAREELFTNRAAIAAAKSGQLLPAGTVITLVDYKDDKLFRYVVMEKQHALGSRVPA